MAFDLKKIANGIVDYMPTVAGLLATTGVGVPEAGALEALALVGKSLGLGTDAKPEDIHAALTAAPLDADTKLKMLALDNDFKTKQGEQRIKALEDTLNDIQGARQAKVDSEKATGKRDKNLMVMSWAGIVVALIVFVLTTYLAVTKQMEAAVAAMVGNMSGIFLAKYSTVFDFWMGGAKVHDDTTQPIK